MRVLSRVVLVASSLVLLRYHSTLSRQGGCPLTLSAQSGLQPQSLAACVFRSGSQSRLRVRSLDYTSTTSEPSDRSRGIHRITRAREDKGAAAFLTGFLYVSSEAGSVSISHVRAGGATVLSVRRACTMPDSGQREHQAGLYPRRLALLPTDSFCSTSSILGRPPDEQDHTERVGSISSALQEPVPLQRHRLQPGLHVAAGEGAKAGFNVSTRPRPPARTVRVPASSGEQRHTILAVGNDGRSNLHRFAERSSPLPDLHLPYDR